MDRDAAITKLKEHEAESKHLGVEHLYLFGSTARGEAREDSDVDHPKLEVSHLRRPPQRESIAGTHSRVILLQARLDCV